MMVVGVLGRLVAVTRERRSRPDGCIDLEHLRLPDPLGATLAALAARIERLESGLAVVTATRATEPFDPA
ncbi:serine O-acetyltransferase [Methylobacterium nodulans ORS 2060]|uniref:Serine O-acetyltransferase n=1 Tax=Methylobacterium nodulans (strain LMG 21967 / CNCM I-2342 / ORS 2060) TaxID=460265 RepID=B8ITI5_METNO|nr:serine O-acetyltransferase [Methylobacterium nodulans ORS 2060]